MKEICLDARMAFHSGIGTYLRNIIPLLQNGPFKVRLIVSTEIVKKWPEITSSFDLILSSASIYSIAEQVIVPLLVPRCDLFWSPHYNTPLIPVRARKRVTTIHDVYHLAYSKDLSWPKRAYANAVMKNAVKISDHILTNSKFSKDEIMKYTGIDENKITAIHLGVDSSFFRPMQEGASQELVRKKYPLPQKYFLFVSNLAPQKNIGRLLLAWNILARDFPDWKLILVGRKAQAYAWEDILDQIPFLKNRVVLLGQVDNQDLPALYQLASGTVHPSFYEGFGLTPLEAMSCGCPVVVSKAASLPEVCGDSAVYVDPYDEQDIADGIRKIIEDQNIGLQLKEKGLKRSQKFTWKKTAEKHIEILDRLA